MKTIKVFIASSEELKPERDKLLIIEKTTNRHLKHLGVEIDIEEWEYMDSSVGEQHKQEDYNDILRTCDICCVICWQKFGKYTEYEFQTAYEEMCKGQNPRKIYVYFKHPGQDSPELKEFKGKLGEIYGHFPNMFESPEDFGLHFSHILYGEAIKHTKNADDSSDSQVDNDDDNESQNDFEIPSKVAQYTVRNSCVEFDGEIIGDFMSFPFAKNNIKYNLLKQEIEILEKQLPDYQELSPAKYQRRCQELSIKRDELQSLECSLLKTYCSLTQFLSDHNSPRVRETYKKFERGDDLTIDLTLDDNQIQQDFDTYTKSFNEIQSKFSDILSESILKIEILKSQKESNWFQDCISIFEMTKDAVCNIIPDQDYASFLTDYAVFLQVNGQFDDNKKNENFDKALKLFQESKIIWDYLYAKNPISHTPQLAFFLNKYAILQKKLKNRDFAIELYTEAIQLYTKLAENDAAAYLPKIAQTRGNRAIVYKLLKEYECATQEYLWVIDEYKRLEKEHDSSLSRHLARNLQNLGILYKDTISKNNDNLDKAIMTFDEAFNIYTKLAETDPNTYRYNMALVLRNKAQAYNKAHNYNDAQKQAIESSRILNELLQRVPHHIKAKRKYCLVLSELSLYSTRIGLYKEAEQYVRESMETEQRCQLFKGKRAAALKNLGYALLFQGKYAEAEKCILDAAHMKKESAATGTWESTIVKELEKFKAEKLVDESNFVDIDRLLTALYTLN